MKRWMNGSLIFIFFGLCAVTAGLTLENMKLKDALNEKYSASSESKLYHGGKVKPIRATTLDNRETVVAFQDGEWKHHLIFVFNTTCSNCLQNLPSWNMLSKFHMVDSTRVIGISLDEMDRTRTYVSKRDVAFEIYSVVDSSFKRDYRVAGVPLTILVGTGGLVQGAWCGILNADTLHNIVEMIK
jgi:hypothetical protein